jgi:hypothetical protein
VVAGWSVVGPLAGVLVGAYIANRNQRRRWLADKKMEEYREILAAINNAVGVYLNARRSVPNVKAWYKAHPEIFMSVAVVLQNRIFTVAALQNMHLLNRFGDACDDLATTEDMKQFGDTVEALIRELREAVVKDVGT